MSTSFTAEELAIILDAINGVASNAPVDQISAVYAKVEAGVDPKAKRCTCGATHHWWCLCDLTSCEFYNDSQA